MCLTRKAARANVGNPDLDRPQPAPTQPRPMCANLVSGLGRLGGRHALAFDSVTCNLPHDRPYGKPAQRSVVFSRQLVPDLYFNKTQGTPLYTPDLDRPAYRKEGLATIGGRLTWQASQRNKVSAFVDVQHFPLRGRAEFASPEAYCTCMTSSQGCIRPAGARR